MLYYNVEKMNYMSFSELLESAELSRSDSSLNCELFSTAFTSDKE